LVQMYLDTKPDRSLYEFLRYDFDSLERRYGRIVGTAFRTFPSYPQLYLEPLPEQPTAVGERVVPMKFPVRRQRYTDADLDLRIFFQDGSRRLLAGPREPEHDEKEAA